MSLQYSIGATGSGNSGGSGNDNVPVALTVAGGVATTSPGQLFRVVAAVNDPISANVPMGVDRLYLHVDGGRAAIVERSPYRPAGDPICVVEGQNFPAAGSMNIPTSLTDVWDSIAAPGFGGAAYSWAEVRVRLDYDFGAASYNTSGEPFDPNITFSWTDGVDTFQTLRADFRPYFTSGINWRDSVIVYGRVPRSLAASGAEWWLDVLGDDGNLPVGGANGHFHRMEVIGFHDDAPPGTIAQLT